MRLLVAVLVLASCSKTAPDTEASQLERLANPILDKLKPVATKIAALGATDDPQSRADVAVLCSSVDRDLRGLVDNMLTFHEWDADHPGSSAVDIPTAARQIVDGRIGLCPGGTAEKVCSEYCVGRWNALAESVTRFNRNAGAKAHLVELR